jgi:hypothetical protein
MIILPQLFLAGLLKALPLVMAGSTPSPNNLDLDVTILFQNDLLGERTLQLCSVFCAYQLQQVQLARLPIPGLFFSPMFPRRPLRLSVQTSASRSGRQIRVALRVSDILWTICCMKRSILQAKITG